MRPERPPVEYVTISRQGFYRSLLMIVVLKRGSVKLTVAVHRTITRYLQLDEALGRLGVVRRDRGCMVGTRRMSFECTAGCIVLPKTALWAAADWIVRLISRRRR